MFFFWNDEICIQKSVEYVLPRKKIQCYCCENYFISNK